MRIICSAFQGDSSTCQVGFFSRYVPLIYISSSIFFITPPAFQVHDITLLCTTFNNVTVIFSESSVRLYQFKTDCQSSGVELVLQFACPFMIHARHGSLPYLSFLRLLSSSSKILWLCVGMVFIRGRDSATRLSPGHERVMASPILTLEHAILYEGFQLFAICRE